MVSYNGLELNANATHDIEPLFKALYLMSRTPNCEEVSTSISALLSQEFMKFPEVMDTKKQRCRRVENLKYFPNGMIQLQGMPGFTVMGLPWEPELAPHVPSPSSNKEKQPSYIYLKELNPLWYAQLMLFLKRKFSVQKSKRFDFDSLFEKQAIYDGLTDEEKEQVDATKIQDAISDEAQRLHELFSFNAGVVNLYYSYRREAEGEPQVQLPENAFFFLTDDECLRLQYALDKDGIGGRKNARYYDTQNLTAAVADILTSPPKDRVWIMRPAHDAITRVEERVQQVDETRYYPNRYRRVVYNHELIREAYNEEFQDLSEEHLYLLSRFGIVVNNPEEGQEEE